MTAKAMRDVSNTAAAMQPIAMPTMAPLESLWPTPAAALLSTLVVASPLSGVAFAAGVAGAAYTESCQESSRYAALSACARLTCLAELCMLELLVLHLTLQHGM